MGGVFIEQQRKNLYARRRRDELYQSGKKTFLTQQCISEHIKKLEREYGVSFFERRPKLVLTPAGKSMYQAMLQIQNMKNSLELNLKEIARGAMGEIKNRFQRFTGSRNYAHII